MYGKFIRLTRSMVFIERFEPWICLEVVNLKALRYGRLRKYYKYMNCESHDRTSKFNDYNIVNLITFVNPFIYVLI